MSEKEFFKSLSLLIFLEHFYPLSTREKEEKTLFWSHNISQFFLNSMLSSLVVSRLSVDFS